MVRAPQPFQDPSDILVTEVAHELLDGRDPREITEVLERIGWSDARIQNLLEAVDERISQGLELRADRGLRMPRGARPGRGRRAGSGDGAGLVMWLGFLIGFNVLSFVFDWGWIVY